MNDAVVLRTHSEMLDAELLTVSLEGVNLLLADRVINALLLVRRSIVVRHSYNVVGTENLYSLVTKSVKSLW